MKEVKKIELAIRETAETIKDSVSHGWTQSIDEIAEQMIAKYTEGAPVKFISYTGGYPNLCSGILTLEIEGELATFGSPYFNRPRPQYPEFWISGGYCDWDGYITTGKWKIDLPALPAKYKLYAAEIEAVFNANVPWGCCGGCV